MKRSNSTEDRDSVTFSRSRESGLVAVGLMALSIAVGCGAKPKANPAPVPVTAAASHAAPANTNAINTAATSGAKLVRTIGKLGRVARLAISSDGRRLLTLEQPATVRGWDVETGAELSLDLAQMFPALEIASPGLGFVGGSRFLVVPVQASDAVGSVVPASFDPCALSADSQWILSVHRDGRSVDLYHVASAQRVRGYAAAESPVSQLCFSQTGEQFFAALTTGEIVVRDLRTGLEVHRVPAAAGFQGAAPQVTFSPGRDTVLMAFPDGTCRGWDLRQGRSLAEFQVQRVAAQNNQVTMGGSVTRATFSPNGRGLLAALSNGEHVLVDATSGDELLALAAPARSQGASPGGMGGSGGGFGGLRDEAAFPAAVFSSDSHRVVTPFNSGSEGSLQVWELPDIVALRETGDRPTAAGSSVDLAFGIRARSADSNAVAATPFRKARRASTETPHGLSAIAIGRSGRRGWGTGAMPGDNSVAIGLHQFDTSTGTVEHSTPIGTALDVAFERLIVSPDESRLAVTSSAGGVVVIDAATRQTLSRIAPPGGAVGTAIAVRAACFSRDGTLIVVVRDTLLGVYRTDSGDVVRRFSYADRRPKSNAAQTSTGGMAFGGIGRGLGGAGGPMSGFRASEESNAFFSATLSPDAEQLIVVTADGGLETYEMDSGKRTTEFQCRGPSAVTFTPDGRQVLIGSAEARSTGDDQHVVVGEMFDVATGSQVASLRDSEPDPIVCGDFSDDGRWLVTLHASGRCQRWATETGHKTGFSSLSDVDVDDDSPGPGGRGLPPGAGLRPTSPFPGGGVRSMSMAGRVRDTSRSLVGLTVLDDATQFWTVNGGGVMALWNVSRQTSAANSPPPEKGVTSIAERGSLRGPGSAVITLAVSPDVTRSIAVTQTGELLVWDLKTLDIERQMSVATPQSMSSLSCGITFAPDSKGAAFATGLRGPLVLNLINFSLGAPGVREAAPAKLGTKASPKTTPKKGKSVSVNTPDSMLPGMVSAMMGDGAPVPQYQGGRVLSLAFYPDGKFLLCGHLDGSVTRVDRANGQSKAIDKRPHPILKVDVSKAAQRLMAYDGETVSLWETASGKAVRQVKVPTEAPGRLEFSADGRRAAVWDERQREIVVLDLDQGTETKRIALSKGEEGQLPFAISSDGRWLLAGSPSNRVTTVFPEDPAAAGYGLDGTAPGGGAPMRAGPGAHNAPATVAAPNRGASLKLDASLKLIVKHLDPTAGSTDLKFWSLESGKVVAVLKGHTEAVVSVALSPDGKTALTAGLDQTVRVWSLP